MNSLPENESMAGFIRASLEILEEECPQAYRQLCRQMANRKALIQVGEEWVPLRFETDRVVLLPHPDGGAADVCLRTDRQAILDLAEANMTLIDGVLNGRLDLIGEATDLAIFYESILTYLRGAVRCRSFPALLDQFRLSRPVKVLD